MSEHDLEPAPTIRSAKWDGVLRLIDYLNKKWAHATAHGHHEITLKFPTQLVSNVSDALRHMTDTQMPLYRLHVDVEEYSRSMLENAAMAEATMQEVAIRASEMMADVELMVERLVGRPRATIENIRHVMRKMREPLSQAPRRGEQMAAAVLSLPS